ncbi:MAG: cytochrome c biogenesis protein CcsA [Caldimonas sp.]
MILSFGSSSEGPQGTALALSVPSLVALLCYAAAALPGARYATPRRTALLLAWLAQGAAIVIDIAGFGAPVSGARFGFAPALSVTLWLVLAVYGLESRFVPLHGARWRLALLGCAVVALAWAFPGQSHPQAASRWAPLHWLLGIASYGLFGVAVLHAAMLNRAERLLRKTPAAPGPAGGVPLLRLERLTYRFVAAGFAMLSAAILLGAWFASPWRWDHKTVFSILGWIVFAALLAGRRAFGWRGPQATRWLYLGAGLLLLGYVGSRFVFEVLLHRMPTA